MTFGQKLRELREQAGLGVRELSRASHLSLSHVQYLEADKKRPGDDTLGRLAPHLGVPKQELIRLRDELQVDTNLTVLLKEAGPELTDEKRQQLLDLAHDILEREANPG